MKEIFCGEGCFKCLKMKDGKLAVRCNVMDPNHNEFSTTRGVTTGGMIITNHNPRILCDEQATKHYRVQIS